MSNVNDVYFKGHYKNIWKEMIPQELSTREVEFIVTYFKLQPGMSVLDMMCGHGRHTVPLARKGIEVTAVDNLPEYIEEITNTAAAEDLPIEAIESDMLSFRTEKNFDLAICMGNSLNFFPPSDVKMILSNLSSQIKKGGALLINSWSLAEIAIRSFKDKTWGYAGDIKMLSDAKYLFNPARIETENIFISPNGETETKTGIDYIYSIAEMETFLLEAGLRLTLNYSIPGKKEFAFGDGRSYMIAEKI
jgi:SAM-dependent methyltransferase